MRPVEVQRASQDPEVFADVLPEARDTEEGGAERLLGVICLGDGLPPARQEKERNQGIYEPEASQVSASDHAEREEPTGGAAEEGPALVSHVGQKAQIQYENCE